MKKLLAVVSLFLIYALCTTSAGTLFPVPILVVTPQRLDFGSVPRGTTRTNTFLVENAGCCELVGKATAPPPFRIISGGSYRLRQGDVQVVTIIYSPTDTGNDRRTVTFTGASGANIPVTGRLAQRGIPTAGLEATPPR